MEQELASENKRRTRSISDYMEEVGSSYVVPVLVVLSGDLLWRVSISCNTSFSSIRCIWNDKAKTKRVSFSSSWVVLIGYCCLLMIAGDAVSHAEFDVTHSSTRSFHFLCIK